MWNGGVAFTPLTEIEIHHPSERQKRVEFGCGVRLVITDESQLALAASPRRHSAYIYGSRAAAKRLDKAVEKYVTQWSNALCIQ
jgi:hypothetical protein